MNKFILIFQILISGALIVLILLQSRGTGLESSFTGTNFYRSKRGIEKLIFVATVVLVVFFLGGAILNTLISLR
ncbi:MAG: preprotein translocase subunit SecG [Microgenomates group bacterium]